MRNPFFLFIGGLVLLLSVAFLFVLQGQMTSSELWTKLTTLAVICSPLALVGGVLYFSQSDRQR